LPEAYALEAARSAPGNLTGREQEVLALIDASVGNRPSQPG
jgi:hypothetical protein